MFPRTRDSPALAVRAVHDTLLLALGTAPAATAPAFTEGYPAVVDVSSDAATLDVSLADDGGVYWVVLTAVEVPPTSDEVLAGHGSGGSQPVSAGAHPTMVHDTVMHLALASIAPSTNYIVYVVATDTNTPPTTQAQPTAVSFTTPGTRGWRGRWRG